MRCQFNYSLKLQSIIKGCCQTSHKKPNNWHSAEHNKVRNQYSNIVKGHSSNVCLSFCRHWQQYGCHNSSLCIYFFIFWFAFKLVIQTGLPSSFSALLFLVWTQPYSCISTGHTTSAVCRHSEELGSMELSSMSKTTELCCGERWTCNAHTHSSNLWASKARWWNRSKHSITKE